MTAALAEGAAPSAKGLDALKKSLVTVEAAASASGVAAEQILAAAKAYAAAKNPVIVIGTGISASEEASTQALEPGAVEGRRRAAAPARGKRPWRDADGLPR